jgi:hypothetical protein
MKEVTTVKRPDLLFLVAIWQFVSAFLLLVGISAIATFALPEALGYKWGPADTGAIFALSFAIFVLICLIGLSLAGGIGILKAKSWGRMISIVNAILSLFNIPIGTVIGIFVLMYLSKTEVREYFEGSG